MVSKKSCLQSLIYYVNRIEVRNYLLNNLEHGEYKGTAELVESKTTSSSTRKVLKWVREIQNKPIAFSLMYKTKHNFVHYNSIWIQKNGKKLKIYHFDSGTGRWEGMTGIMHDFMINKIIPALEKNDFVIEFVTKNYQIQKITNDNFCQCWSLIWLQEHSIRSNMKITDNKFGSLNREKAKKLFKDYIEWWFEENEEFKSGWIDEVVKDLKCNRVKAEELITKEIEKGKF